MKICRTQAPSKQMAEPQCSAQLLHRRRHRVGTLVVFRDLDFDQRQTQGTTNLKRLGGAHSAQAASNKNIWPWVKIPYPQ